MVIVANNDAFSQMLEAELSLLGISAHIADNFDANERFAIVDLDFCDTVPVGISAITYSRSLENCDLLRPFLMKNFRELVKAKFFDGERADRNLVITENGVWMGEFPIELSKKEKDLLLLLFENRNTPVFEAEIREKIFANTQGNVCSVYIGYLRNKIDVKYSKKYIYTVRGGGYMLKI